MAGPSVRTDRNSTAETVGAALIDSARRSPGATAIIFPDQRWTYEMLLEQATARARALRSRGLAPGDVIGLTLEDGPEFIALFLGAALCGIVPALFEPGVVRASILAPRLPFLAARLFIVSGSEGRAFAEMLIEAHALIGREIVPSLNADDASYRDFLNGGSHDTWDAAGAAGSVQPEQDAAIVFTSGMTGLPKTCPVSHRNLMCKVKPFCERFELSSGSRLWIGVSMFQIGFVAPFLTAITVGATLIVSQKLTADGIRSLLEAQRVTHAYPIYLRNWLPIVYAPQFWPSQFSHLSHVCLVGPTTALRRVQRALPQTVVMNTYGSAEEAGAFCMPRSSDPVDVRLASSGPPFPAHEVRIVVPDTGVTVRRGEIGEIQVRGTGVPQPHPTNDFGSNFTADGWLRTSDLGEILTDGSLVYHGRRSEMLKIGAATVSAVRIETVLMLHGDVAVAQVVGHPDEHLGEVAAAFVELRHGGTVTPDALVEFCRMHLPVNQIPRYIRFVSDWPTSASKIYKPLLTSMPVGPRLRV